jgi:hypothetical protein
VTSHITLLFFLPSGISDQFKSSRLRFLCRFDNKHVISIFQMFCMLLYLTGIVSPVVSEDGSKNVVDCRS